MKGQPNLCQKKNTYVRAKGKNRKGTKRTRREIYWKMLVKNFAE